MNKKVMHRKFILSAILEQWQIYNSNECVGKGNKYFIINKLNGNDNTDILKLFHMKYVNKKNKKNTCCKVLFVFCFFLLLADVVKDNSQHEELSAGS